MTTTTTLRPSTAAAFAQSEADDDADRAFGIDRTAYDRQVAKLHAIAVLEARLDDDEWF